MAWIPHYYSGQTYRFTHLEPHTEVFSRPAYKDHSAETFTVDVRYSDHCFTRRPKTNERYDGELVYRNREKKIRLFCPKRYEMSKLLPDFIRGLPNKKPHHNGKNGNFFILETLDSSGNPVRYVIIFSVRKSAKKRLELLVETAFMEEPDYGSAALTGRPVRFWIILNNTYKGLNIHR